MVLFPTLAADSPRATPTAPAAPTTEDDSEKHEFLRFGISQYP